MKNLSFEAVCSIFEECQNQKATLVLIDGYTSTVVNFVEIVKNRIFFLEASSSNELKSIFSLSEACKFSLESGPDSYNFFLNKSEIFLQNKYNIFRIKVCREVKEDELLSFLDWKVSDE